MSTKTLSGPRNIALVGAYSSGKTTLLESLLFAAGALNRKGTIGEGNTVADGSAEARARHMSVEVSVATFDYMGETLTILDCPGSLEFMQEAQSCLAGVDCAVVVCEADVGRAVTLTPLLRLLDARKIPYMLFINKMDRATTPVREFLSTLQGYVSRPLVLRQIPISEDDKITGYIDLVHERAYEYADDAGSSLIQIPNEMSDDESLARGDMLEALADFDDTLLEQLLEDVVPPTDEIYATLHKDVSEGLVVPVFLGAAEHQNGVRRLLKALRHDVPESSQTAVRVGLADGPETAAQVLKTFHTASSGKLSLVRVWRGVLKDGMSLNGHRVGSVNRMFGQNLTKVGAAQAGEIVALGRMDEIKTGDMLSSGAEVETPEEVRIEPMTPVYNLAVAAANRGDEVKLSDALHKLVEEDISLIAEPNQDTHQMLLWGQGDIHLRVALERAASKFHVALETMPPAVPYKETIRKPANRVHGRHKKQSGGHGQFGDVVIDIKPLARGNGIEFGNTVVGGSVPRQYIPAVEQGVINYCARGPLGFQVVDVSVTLTDGSFHAVDSSEMAFQTAARIAMNAGMPKCSPMLLEPVFHVDVHAPSEFTAQIQRLLSGRRGQILGFEPRSGWSGWDEVSAQLPQSELQDLIIDLRSLTRGVGSFDYRFDHLQGLSGKLADDVVAAASEAAQ